MSNLQLSLKTKWFELTKAGIKTEDYREITPYWSKRLIHNLSGVFLDDKELLNFLTAYSGKFRFNNYETNTMTLGYPKSSDSNRILKLEHKGIEIRKGNSEWGAEPNKLYFVIMHGSVVE